MALAEVREVKGTDLLNEHLAFFRAWPDCSEGNTVVLFPPSPLQEENSLFVMTNLITTINQTQGLCPEVGSFSGKSLRLLSPTSPT